MKLANVFLLAALSSSSLAQQEFLDSLPQCAARCVVASLNVSSCQPSDFSCLCADTPFMGAAAACNSANCSVVNVLSATNLTYAACGIPIRDQSASLVGTSASVGGFALLMIIMRLVDRTFTAHGQLGVDDFFIFLSGLCGIGMNVPVIVAAALGFGRDMWGMTPHNITESLKGLYVAYFMYMMAECFCQLSILSFYLRIMVDVKQRWAVWALIVMVSGFGVGNTVGMVFQCTPIHFFWDGWKGEMAGYCGVDVRLFAFVRGGVEIFLDLAILSLPLPMLAKLNMSSKKKLQIMSMFCVGFVITVVSCLRLWSFVKFGNTTNPTYDNTSGLIWCATESNLFQIVACMPSMRAIGHRILRQVRGLSTYASSATPGKGSYIRQTPDPLSKEDSRNMKKGTDFSLFHTERSSSDIELVNSPPP